ncbi:MAG TPA: hypothetical protein VKA48_00475, partial [Gammaproteobacteria bacterium]|nr:hypothetical protein [Gammaproteobacteria bacterium]
GITDPLGRANRLAYDAAGRLIAWKRPDGNTVHYTYDDRGNLTSIQPPGRTVHTFTYAADNRREDYESPRVNGIAAVTRYRYNQDRQLRRIARPGGATVQFAYNQAGRPSGVRIPVGGYSYAYDTGSGHLTTITAPGGQSLDLEYNGFLPTGSQWNGAISGTVSRGYEENFWITSRSVNGKLIGFSYDADGLLTRAGHLALTRDRNHGAVTGTRLGQVATAREYNGFAELNWRSVGNPVTVHLDLSRSTVTADHLNVKGTIPGAGQISIDGKSLNVAADGTFNGQVPLPVGEQDLSVEVFGGQGHRVYSGEVTLRRAAPDAGLQQPIPMAVAGNGDVYYLQGGVGDAQRLRHLSAGADRPGDPTWLDGAIDIARAGDTFYLLKGNVGSRDQLALWAHNASGNRLVANLGGQTVLDMEVGPRGGVYLTTGNRILRVNEDGSLAEHAVLDSRDKSLKLDASSWGLVAASFDSGRVYRIGSYGKAVKLYEGRFQDFAVDGSGRVCFTSRSIVASLGPGFGAPSDEVKCHSLNAATEILSGWGGTARYLEFGPGGALNIGGQNNIVRHSSTGFSALAAPQPEAGTLKITGTTGQDFINAYIRDKLGRITEETET